MDPEAPPADPAPTSLLMWLGYRAAEDRIAARGRELIPVARAEERRVDAEWETHLGAERMALLRAALAELRGLVDP